MISKSNTHQVDLNSNPLYVVEKRNKNYMDLRDEIREDIRNELIMELNEQKTINDKSHLISIDMESNARMICYSGLLEDLVESFTKIYDWLDSGAKVIKFSSDSKYITIEPDEVKAAIKFIEKLNKFPMD